MGGDCVVLFLDLSEFSHMLSIRIDLIQDERSLFSISDDLIMRGKNRGMFGICISQLSSLVKSIADLNPTELPYIQRSPSEGMTLGM